ncbi:MAG: hypothetical protein OET90_03255 [Desulfuromonadales bacterium]|nr:hypothetical protein [Desulfuromonadales bacterium]
MIVGIGGKAATGKTTAAKHLKPLFDCEVHIIPMAMVLRDEVEAFLRAVGAQDSVPLVYGDQEDKVQLFYVDQQRALAECGQWADFVAVNQNIQDRDGMTAVTVRLILQWWGTEYRRASDPDYWVKAWERKIKQYDLERCHVLVDDIRFVNELTLVRRLGGKLVKVERPGFNGANNHASETSLDDFDQWDQILCNDGTLEQFEEMVSALPDALCGD